MLTDPAHCPPRPRTAVPSDVADYRPAVAAALRGAKRGGAAGLTGMRAEHSKVLLQDQPALEFLAYAATRLANAQVPADIVPGIALARLTALSKRARHSDKGRFRAPLRRVGQPLLTEPCGPYQFAFQVRAGADALAAHVRVQEPNQVLVSLDGRSAYDSVSTALKSVAPELLPFVLWSFHVLLVGRVGGIVAMSPKERDASKVTRWLRHFLPLASMPLYARPRPRSTPPSDF
ncbi:unnamed protein product [Symbiodinium natans]|uniref:Reverse transcriptase domain-containing protein n=1 Tax=Symbiodinium natans TaxID=878477 RepID=A0A812J7U0_9DINO|nr:unnamed protein product [Symbiodinium natans]